MVIVGGPWEEVATACYRFVMVAVPPLGPEKHAVALATWGHLPLRVRAALPISDDELFELCQINRDFRIERTPDGEILIAGDPVLRGFVLDLGRIW